MEIIRVEVYCVYFGILCFSVTVMRFINRFKPFLFDPGRTMPMMALLLIAEVFVLFWVITRIKCKLFCWVGDN